MMKYKIVSSGGFIGNKAPIIKEGSTKNMPASFNAELEKILESIPPFVTIQDGTSDDSVIYNVTLEKSGKKITLKFIDKLPDVFKVLMNKKS